MATIPNPPKAYLGARYTSPRAPSYFSGTRSTYPYGFPTRKSTAHGLWNHFLSTKRSGNMHTMRSVASYTSRPAGESPAKCSTRNYAQLNAKSAAILAATSTFLLANGFASSVCRRINDIYHCGIVMRFASLGLTVRSLALCLA